MTDTFAHRAAVYADDVIGGKIDACEHVKNACRRFVADLQRDDIYLSDDGEKWCGFLEKLPHVKGRWAARKELLVLAPYQIFIIVNLYGWKCADTDLRRYREAYVEVPRKNGKTFMVAGLGLAHMLIDDEFGAEVYCGATSKAQAMEVFFPSRLMCQRDDNLRDFFDITVFAQSLSVESTGSKFVPVIGNPGDGSSPSAAIVDEFHEHLSAAQVDTFTTGMGAREQPMMIYITTAGVDVGGPCYAKRSDVISILKGTTEDDTIFGIIYGLDEDDEWNTLEAQKKANPNYGVSVQPAFLAAQLKQAMRTSEKQSVYKTKHLNQWVGAKAAWMNMLAYQACRSKTLSINDYAGQPCYIALDLASKKDIASMAIIFPQADKHAVFCKHYLPEAALEGGQTSATFEPERYRAWREDGWLTTSPGNRMDFQLIKDDIAELHTRFDIVDLAYDPFQAAQLAGELLDDGYPVVEFGATVKNFSEPMKELDNLIATKGIVFETDKALHWMFGNVVAKVDAKDNIFPRKERDENKIDGVVAIIMALGRMIARSDNVISFPSDYEIPVA